MNEGNSLKLWYISIFSPPIRPGLAGILLLPLHSLGLNWPSFLTLLRYLIFVKQIKVIFKLWIASGK